MRGLGLVGSASTRELSLSRQRPGSLFGLCAIAGRIRRENEGVAGVQQAVDRGSHHRGRTQSGGPPGLSDTPRLMKSRGIFVPGVIRHASHNEVEGGLSAAGVKVRQHCRRADFKFTILPPSRQVNSDYPQKLKTDS